jgi:hypothetical protein
MREEERIRVQLGMSGYEKLLRACGEKERWESTNGCDLYERLSCMVENDAVSRPRGPVW